MARRRQPMFGRQGCASDVEGVFAAVLFVFGSETVGKLRTVVGEDLADLDGRSQLETRRKSTLLASVMSL